MNMNINRHNYEEYFVLYLDNELSPEECRQVKEFVAANPDLKEELEMLEHSKLEADPAITIDKSLLFRTEESNPVNHSNYEEYLVRYTDHELSPEERTFVERYLEKNPAAQQELALFQQTVSQPDTAVVFPDKDLLYKKEEPATRVIVMRWWKVAVAAAVLITAGLISYNTFFQPASTVNQTAGTQGKVNTPVETKANPANNTGSQDVASKDTDAPIPSDQPLKDQDKNEAPVVNATHNDFNQIARVSKTVQPSASDKKDQPAGHEAPEQREEERAMYAKLDQPINTLALTPEKNDLPSQGINESPVTSAIGSPSREPAGPDIVTLDDEPNRKSRGLFRKATRVFERRTNINATDDDERLLIGGFVVKLK